MDGSHECWQPARDSALVWTQPHALIGGFARLLAGEEADTEQLLLAGRPASRAFSCA